MNMLGVQMCLTQNFFELYILKVQHFYLEFNRTQNLMGFATIEINLVMQSYGSQVFRARGMLYIEEVVGFLWSLTMMLFTLFCCKLFESFLAAKPEGRKTVIGKSRKVCCSFMFHC